MAISRFAITRRSALIGLAAGVGSFGLAACGAKDDKAADAPADPNALVDGEKKNGDVVTITVGCSPVPHALVLTYVKDNLLEGTGIDLDIKEINDYLTPNTALQDGSLAANYFQTPNYLKQQIADNGYDFVSIADVHIEPLGLYSRKYSNVADIPEGATITLNNDPANTARGLKLLETAGLLTLDPAVEVPSEADIKDNPKNLVIKAIDGAQVATSLDDVDAGVVNGNFAIDAGLVPSKDALVLEPGENSPYANELVVRAEDKDNVYLRKLADILTSEDVKGFIASQWSDGSVIAAF